MSLLPDLKKWETSPNYTPYNSGRTDLEGASSTSNHCVIEEFKRDEQERADRENRRNSNKFATSWSKESPSHLERRYVLQTMPYLKGHEQIIYCSLLHLPDLFWNLASSVIMIINSFCREMHDAALTKNNEAKSWIQISKQDLRGQANKMYEIVSEVQLPLPSCDPRDLWRNPELESWSNGAVLVFFIRKPYRLLIANALVAGCGRSCQCYPWCLGYADSRLWGVSCRQNCFNAASRTWKPGRRWPATALQIWSKA